jgi:hypothetical protein
MRTAAIQRPIWRREIELQSEKAQASPGNRKFGSFRSA